MWAENRIEVGSRGSPRGARHHRTDLCRRRLFMDFDNPAALFSGLFIGLVGMGLFIYGKKQQNLRCLVGGMAMCVYPYFVTSLLLTWILAAICVGGVVVAGKLE
jgi:hypothetical protein